jgi:hypothetical protein
VRDLGGGLLVVGGDKAFGSGGYTHTPLDDILPVRMDLRGKSLSTSVALILVTDVSGSMGGGPGGASKMDLAKEAALAAVNWLGEYDQIGILAFDDHNQLDGKADLRQRSDADRRRHQPHAAGRWYRDLPSAQGSVRQHGAARCQGQTHHSAD